MKKPIELPEEQRERMTQGEMSTVLMMLNAFSLLFGAETSLEKRFSFIPDGKRRFRMVKGQAESLMLDIIGTITEPQRQRLNNTIKDYKVSAVPKLTPESKNVIVERDKLEMLVNEARIKCLTCMEDRETCKRCKLFQFLDGYTPLDDYYHGFLCPYSNADWEMKKKNA